MGDVLFWPALALIACVAAVVFISVVRLRKLRHTIEHHMPEAVVRRDGWGCRAIALPGRRIWLADRHRRAAGDGRVEGDGEGVPRLDPLASDDGTWYAGILVAVRPPSGAEDNPSRRYTGGEGSGPLRLYRSQLISQAGHDP